jgi:hypothetical protein
MLRVFAPHLQEESRRAAAIVRLRGGAIANGVLKRAKPSFQAISEDTFSGALGAL